MFLLQQYIFSSLVRATLSIGGILTAIIWLTQSLRFWGFVAYKGVTIWEFISSFSFLLPSVLMLSLPFGFLLGILWVYYHLIHDHEREAISCCGVSDLFFVVPCLALSLILSVFLYSVSFLILPLSSQYLHKREVQLKDTFTSSLLSPGRFVSFHQATIYAKKQAGDNIFEGILIHDARTPKRPRTICGERAAITKTESGSHITVQNGMLIETPPPPKKASILVFREYTFDIQPSQSGKHGKRIHENTLYELLNPHERMSVDKKRLFWAEAQQRFILPFLPITYAALASFVLFRIPVRRRGRWKGAFFAFLSALVIQIMVMVGMHPVMPPFLSYVTYGLLFAPFALWVYDAITHGVIARGITRRKR